MRFVRSVTGEAVIRKDWPDVAIELDTCQKCGLRSEEAKEYFHRDHQKGQLRVKGSFTVPGHRFQAVGAILLWEGAHGTNGDCEVAKNKVVRILVCILLTGALPSL
jgi:hypothetical protein